MDATTYDVYVHYSHTYTYTPSQLCYQKLCGINTYVSYIPIWSVYVQVHNICIICAYILHVIANPSPYVYMYTYALCFWPIVKKKMALSNYPGLYPDPFIFRHIFRPRPVSAHSLSKSGPGGAKALVEIVYQVRCEHKLPLGSQLIDHVAHVARWNAGYLKNSLLPGNHKLLEAVLQVFSDVA